MGTKNDPGVFDCYHAAHPNEPMFVLLARDELAPHLVRAWAALRARNFDMAARAFDEALQQSFGRNRETLGSKIAEAKACADAMETWRRGQES